MPRRPAVLAKFTAIRGSFRAASQPFRMDQEREIDLLVFALAEFDLATPSINYKTIFKMDMSRAF